MSINAVAEAMHGPIEAPDRYVNNAFCSQVTTLNKRNIYCGMMACLDEGVGNLTQTYESLSIWEDTLVVLAADNGGHVGSSGNNAPLCVQCDSVSSTTPIRVHVQTNPYECCYCSGEEKSQPISKVVCGLLAFCTGLV